MLPRYYSKDQCYNQQPTKEPRPETTYLNVARVPGIRASGHLVIGISLLRTVQWCRQGLRHDLFSLDLIRDISLRRHSSVSWLRGKAPSVKETYLTSSFTPRLRYLAPA